MRLPIFIAGVLIGTIFFSALVAAWSGPTSTPPNANVSAPINISSTAQVKNGPLWVVGVSVDGNALLYGSSRYINFGTLSGSSGYGVRDNNGILELKNSGGTWAAITTLTGGTTNYIAKYASSTALTQSIILDTGSRVGVSTTSPSQKFSVNGVIYSASGGFRFPDGTVQTSAALGGNSPIEATTVTCTPSITVPIVPPVYYCTMTCPTGYVRASCSGTTIVNRSSGAVVGFGATSASFPENSDACFCSTGSGSPRPPCIATCIR